MSIIIETLLMRHGWMIGAFGLYVYLLLPVLAWFQSEYRKWALRRMARVFDESTTE